MPLGREKIVGSCCCTPNVLDLDCPIHGGLAAEAILNAATVIQAAPPSRCELCGTVAETRPYGPSSEEVCFACGMKDEEAAKAAFDARLTTGPGAGE